MRYKSNNLALLCLMGGIFCFFVFMADKSPMSSPYKVLEAFCAIGLIGAATRLRK